MYDNMKHNNICITEMTEGEERDQETGYHQ